MHIAVVDVGSPAKGNLGWWITGPVVERGGTAPHDLVTDLAVAVLFGPVVLGFEAPMYVPAERDANHLLKARPGEGSRPWSVAAGAATTAAGLAIVPWLLRELNQRAPNIAAWQNWDRKPLKPKEILVFEAFVSGGPSDGHAADARAAALAAQAIISSGVAPISALADEPCISLLGAALLHAGVSGDISELHRPCLVVRGEKHVSTIVYAG